MKWVLQKWEKEVHVESILYPTPSMNTDGSSTSVAEASSTPLDPVQPSSIPSGIVVAAPSADHPTSPTGCPCAQIVVYYWWATQTALNADWDTMGVAWVTMGVAWVVRDSLWNASCASAQRRKQLVK